MLSTTRDQCYERGRSRLRPSSLSLATSPPPRLPLRRRATLHLMPEIPDLEAIRGFLNERIVGVEVTKAEALIPHVVRSGAADFEAALTGNRFGEVLRRGKFLLFGLADGRVMVVNPMLAGRFQYLQPGDASARRRASSCSSRTAGSSATPTAC